MTKDSGGERMRMVVKDKIMEGDLGQQQEIRN